MRSLNRSGLLMGLSLLGLVFGCVASEKQKETQKSLTNHPSRTSASEPIVSAPSNISSSENYLVYSSKDTRNAAQGAEESIEVINLKGWSDQAEQGQAGNRSGYRMDTLTKLYYAGSRQHSNRGLNHKGCFEGNAKKIAESFFASGLSFTPLEVVGATSSADGQAIGIEFNTAKGVLKHFRIYACDSTGKSNLLSDEQLQSLKNAIAQKQSSRAPDAVTASAAAAAVKQKPNAATHALTDTLADLDDALVINDSIDLKNSTDREAAKALPKFTLKANYSEAPALQNTFPWSGLALDLSKPSDALKLAELLQAYAYSGMIQNSAKADFNFNAFENKTSFWCNVPWLNQGEKGREIIHGLTQERELHPSQIWPNAPYAGDWGVGYFNAHACHTLDKIFGSKGKLKDPPKFISENGDKVEFEQGTMIFKMLFTTAADFSPLKGAMTWNAHVSLPGETERHIRPIKHVQMDIAIKDKTLGGLSKTKGQLSASGWVMLTYYFDEAYDSPIAKKMHLPKGLEHMRPMGIQTGFQKEDSIIFAGATTNQNIGMLNGPADNAESSCASCHGTAGQDFHIHPGVPGVTANEVWLELSNNGFSYDFGQQIALARRNWDTRPQHH